MISSILGFDYIFDFEYFLIMVLTVALSLYLKFLLTIFTDYLSVESPENFQFSFLPLAGLIITRLYQIIQLFPWNGRSFINCKIQNTCQKPFRVSFIFYSDHLGIVINVNPSLAINSFCLFLFYFFQWTSIRNSQASFSGKKVRNILTRIIFYKLI